MAVFKSSDMRLILSLINDRVRETAERVFVDANAEAVAAQERRAPAVAEANAVVAEVFGEEQLPV
jgi:hypothetical protein